MTVRLQFPPQVAAAPPPWQPADDARVTREEAAAEARRHREAAAADRRALVTTMLLGAGVFGVMAGGVGRYGLWYARGRDPEAAAVAEFLPEPPDDLGPGAAGALVDEIVHQRDIVATLADLAWKGVLGLRDGTGPSRDDPKVTNLRHDATIRGFERALVETLLVENPGLGATVRLSAVSSRFARAAPRVRGLLDVELVERG